MTSEKRKDMKGRQLKSGESQRADGRYQYQYTGLDKKRHTVYSWRLFPSDSSPNGKTGDKSLREKEKEIQKELARKANICTGNITLNEMFDIYLVKKRRKGKPLSQNTTQNYKKMYDKHVRDSSIGTMKIENIRKSNIVDFYLLLRDKNLSYGTVMFYNKILSAVFNMAIDDNFIEKNPTIRAMNQIEGSQRLREALTESQQKDLLDYAKQYNADMYRKLVFLIDTMCRVSEFAGITWNDIDMKERMIVVDHQLQYLKYPSDEHATYHVNATKGREQRYIPMTDRLYNILKEMRKYYFITRKDIEIDGISNFVFYSGSGEPIRTESFRAELLRLLKGYNFTKRTPIEYLTPHMLRHTGATRNAENGMDLKVLQYLMGHKSSKITNDIYNHVTRERAAQEMLKAAQIQGKRA